jgi:AhpD family alkylhydroperoxidase
VPGFRWEEMNMYDMANMKKLKSLGAFAPETRKAFLAFDQAARADGAIPKKYKELIAVGVALATQCPYCIEIHKQEALKAGATEAELAETTFVTAALRAGAVMTHGTHLISG